MKEVQSIISCLKETPVIMRALLSTIPSTMLKERRVKGKWSIHEQVCHLTEAQGILRGRYKQFEQEFDPLIKNYLPPAGRDADYYYKMDLDRELRQFKTGREELVDWLSSFEDGYWDKIGRHEAFSPYGTKILLMHTLNVDYAHLFSIEQLGLTKEEYSDGIMTLP